MATKQTIIVILLAAAFSACAERQPFERYKSIVDRQMFGELPPGFDPTKMPSEVARGGGKQEKELTKEQEKLQSSIHFSMINVTPDGATAVGFTDNSNPKVPVHYYLKVGESRDGWKVEAADAKAATMTIVKGDVEVSLTLGGNSAKGGGQTQPRGGTAGQPSGQASGSAASGTGSALNTLRGRRAMRERKAEAAQAAELRKLREEQAVKDEEREAKAAEERAQREAEREENRKQLQAIQEELRKAREEAAKESQKEAESDANNNAE